MIPHNKYGVHIVGYGSTTDLGADLKRSAEKSQPFGLVMCMLTKGAGGEAHSYSKKTHTMYRASIEDRDFPATKDGSWTWDTSAECKSSALDWMHACDLLWQGERENFDSFLFMNEPNPVISKIPQFLEWSGYCLDEGERLGYNRLGWGGFSMGCPTEEEMVMMVPFVGELARRGHILCVHDGYWGEDTNFQKSMTDRYGEKANSSLRYRWWWQKLIEAGLPIPDTAITELYAYGRYSPEYYKDWGCYLTEAAKDAKLIGVATYILGDGDGIYRNIAGEPMARMVDQALAIDYASLVENVWDASPAPEVLQVNYINQNGVGAGATRNDCMPACGLMAANYIGGDIHTVDDWYRATGAGSGLITIDQLSKAASVMGYTLNVLRNQSLSTLRAMLDVDKPCILLVSPVGLRRCGVKVTVPHAILVIGYSKITPTTFYIHDPYLTDDGMGGPMIEQPTLEEAWTRVGELGNQPYTMMTIDKGVVVSPTTSVLSGVGTAEARSLIPVEIEAIRVSEVSTVKLLTVQDPEEASLLVDQVQGIASVKEVIARLMFPPDSDNMTPFSPQQFVNYCGEPALTFYSKGIDKFEVHNEPNLALEGWGWNWANGGKFGEWFNEVCLILRRMMPNASLGFPGVSPQPYNTNWCQASDRFIQEAGAAVNAADWLGVHSYWQGRGVKQWQMDSEDGGMYWRSIQRLFPTKKLCLTEYSCNNPDVTDEDKALMYSEYLKKLKGVETAHAFCLNWPGRDVNHEGWVIDGALTQIPRLLGKT